ncbi:Potassium transporter 1 [Dendrobium catenatum]|uniref:Potassium transporter 1 n=1 Tax=Dendrobium catenatum TaxID=906689 RepID=A0A2I0WQ93_9ASPA|nr:Potassium transporter 1 [Dendrobium catenatum]
MSTVESPVAVSNHRLQQQRGLSPELLKYKGPIHCARTIIHEEGFFGLWAGAAPTVMRNGTNQAAMFTAKNAFDVILWKKHEGDGKVLQPWQSMISGFLAGTCGPICTGPFDVVKTRLMAQSKSDGELKYKGMIHAIRTIYVEEGVLALWKGLLPRLMRIPPGQAIMWTVADQITGLAVTIVIFVTTWLMFLVIIIVWKQKIISAIIFLIFFGSIELIYISASFIKIPEGGWIPLTLSIIFMCVMYIWNYGTLLKHEFDLQNKVSVQKILALGPNLGLVRVPGIGLVYTDLVTGVPAVFGHFAMSLPAFHQVLIFVCIKSVQVPFIPECERFLVGWIGPKEHLMFRCIVRYGYKDLRQENHDFENRLVSKIISFVEMEEVLKSEENAGLVKPGEFGLVEGFVRSEQSMEIFKAKESGVVYITGHSYAKARSSSSLIKKLAIDIVYAFLSKNCRAPDLQSVSVLGFHGLEERCEAQPALVLRIGFCSGREEEVLGLREQRGCRVGGEERGRAPGSAQWRGRRRIRDGGLGYRSIDGIWLRKRIGRMKLQLGRWRSAGCWGVRSAGSGEKRRELDRVLCGVEQRYRRRRRLEAGAGKRSES